MGVVCWGDDDVVVRGVVVGRVHRVVVGRVVNLVVVRVVVVVGCVTVSSLMGPADRGGSIVVISINL